MNESSRQAANLQSFRRNVHVILNAWETGERR